MGKNKKKMIQKKVNKMRKRMSQRFFKKFKSNKLRNHLIQNNYLN